MSKSKSRTTGIPAPNRRVEGRKYRSRSEREAQANRITLLVAGILALVIIVILGAALLYEGVFVENQWVAVVNGQPITVRDFQSRVRFERWRQGANLAAYVQQFGAQQLDLSNPQSSFGKLYEQLSVPSSMGQQVLTDMINNLLIAQYAADPANKIQIDQADIDKEMFSYFSYQPTPMTNTPTPAPSMTLTPLVSATPTPTATITPTPSLSPTPAPTVTLTPTSIPTGIPTATPGPTEQKQTYDKNRQDYIDRAAKAVGWGEADLMKIFRENALRKKVLEKIGGPLAKEEEQSKARHILVKTEAEANDVLTALKQGESFAALAKAVSQDNGQQQSQPGTTGQLPIGGSAAQGGELGWSGRDGTYNPQNGQITSYVKEFNDAIWNAQPGDVVGPIKTQFGYHIIQVEAREVRPLDDAASKAAQSKKLDDWLKDQSTKNSTQFPNWIDRVPDDPTLTQLGLPLAKDLPPSRGASPFGNLPVTQ